MPSPSGRSRFLTTRWTNVCRAKSGSEDGRRALADLCDAYYEPVLAFLRSELRDAEAAREMAHSFFAQMLAGGTISRADPDRGRFRCYLLGSVKHFLSHHREAARRAKRGGGVEKISFDGQEGSGIDVADTRADTPDRAFDRQWALSVLGHALEALRCECQAAGREAFFEQAQHWLTGDAAHGDQTDLAAECGMNPAAFKVAVHRLKQNFRRCLKEEIAGTLEDPDMVEEEMRSLFAALAN